MRRATIICAAVLAGTAFAPSALATDASTHHDIRLSLDPDTGVLEAVDRVRIHGGGRVDFGLDPVLTVSAVRVDGRGATPSRRAGGWSVDLGRSGTHEVTVDYGGTLTPLDPSVPGAVGRRAFAGTAGSYLPASVHWFPRFRSAVLTYRVEVRVPAAQRAIAPGRLVEERLTANGWRAVFASEAPARGIVVMAGPYRVETRDVGAITLKTYFHPEIARLSGDYLSSTAGYVERYAKRIGPYPYSAFAVVSGPLPVGLGYPGLTYMGTRVLRLPFIRHTSLGHEVLHTWWGNGVRVDYDSGNWAEGLTTFMADYAFAEDRGPAAAREMRLGWLRNYAALPAARDHAAVAFTAKVHDASQVVGYNKVAFFFYMLRDRLGARTFADGLSLFWKRFRFRVAGWEEMRQVFDEVGGDDLKDFFAQWLSRPGAPGPRLADAAVWRDAGRHGVSFTLSQGAPVYRLALPVAVTTSTGEERFRVTLDGPTSRYRLITRGRPLALAVDPDFDVFRRLAAEETSPILRDVTLDTNAVTVVLADDEATGDVARGLAFRLLDAPPTFAPAVAAARSLRPLLVIGIAERVRTFLAANRLPPLPDSLAGRGTARVWAARHGTRPLLVVAADDRLALGALARPLPHYGRKGYLVFEGAKALDSGSWPAGPGPLRVRFD
jgi:hypothetical protein